VDVFASDDDNSFRDVMIFVGWDDVGKRGKWILREWSTIEGDGKGLEVIGKVWKWLERFGIDWKGLEVIGKVWKWLERFGIDWKGLEAIGKVWNLLERLGSDWKALEAIEMEEKEGFSFKVLIQTGKLKTKLQHVT
jgi:hypothetical protein